MLNMSLGKDEYRSGRNTGVTAYSFLLQPNFSGLETGIAGSGSGFLLVWILLGSRVSISHSVVQLVFG